MEPTGTRRNAAVRLRNFLDGAARDAGFDAVGVMEPDAMHLPGKRLAEFILAGRHGTMDWMAETMERRAAPSALWPDVRRVIVLAMNYGPENDPLDVLDRSDRGAISVYARHRDYHDVIKGRLKTVASKVLSRAAELGRDGEVKVFVDTAPVMEKPLAEKAGIGWQGKHTNLVSREFGSWLFLGSIFTTLDIAVDAPERDHCGSCSNCLDICPTDAFPAPYQLDARRCISYLTIEHDGAIPEALRPAMGNRIYGCDDCLAVCPWNKFARQASETKLAAPEGAEAPRLADLLRLDDAGFRTRYSGSPVKRIGRDRFVRNCLIAAGNSDVPALRKPVADLVDDADPVVSETAAWALRRLDRAAQARR